MSKVIRIYNKRRLYFIVIFTLASVLTACGSKPEDKFVDLIKRTKGNETIEQDLATASVLAKCKTKDKSDAYFGWMEFKHIETIVDQNNQFVARPMAALKIYYIALDENGEAEEIHRGEEYYQDLRSAWRELGCGNLPPKDA